MSDDTLGYLHQSIEPDSIKSNYYENKDEESNEYFDHEKYMRRTFLFLIVLDFHDLQVAEFTFFYFISECLMDNSISLG